MTDIFLYSGDASPNNVILSNPLVPRGGTAVNYTLLLATGVYAYSGKAATLGVSKFLALAVGAYPYSGKAASLTVARALPLAVGSYTYSGKAIAVDFDRQLPLAAGSYAYAGNDATLTYVPGSSAVAYTLALDAGAYGYSGSNATLTYTEGNTKRGGDDVPPRRKSKAEERRKKSQDDLREVLERIYAGLPARPVVANPLPKQQPVVVEQAVKTFDFEQDDEEALLMLL